MLKKLINCAIAAFTALTLAALLVPNFNISGDFKGGIQILLLAGLVLGLINFFVRPLVNIITWPLKMLTFGLFSLVVNIAIVWLIDVLFTEITIKGFSPLFFTSLIIWLLNMAAVKQEK